MKCFGIINQRHISQANDDSFSVPSEFQQADQPNAIMNPPPSPSSTKISPAAPIEATLSRELNIRFIDARELGSQAKLNLGIIGYAADQGTKDLLIQESIRIFRLDRTASTKAIMRKRNEDLETLKKVVSLNSSSSSPLSYIQDDASSSDDQSCWSTHRYD